MEKKVMKKPILLGLFLISGCITQTLSAGFLESLTNKAIGKVTEVAARKITTEAEKGFNKIVEAGKDKLGKIVVVAMDKAGNEVIKKFDPDKGTLLVEESEKNGIITRTRYGTKGKRIEEKEDTRTGKIKRTTTDLITNKKTVEILQGNVRNSRLPFSQCANEKPVELLCGTDVIKCSTCTKEETCCTEHSDEEITLFYNANADDDNKNDFIDIYSGNFDYDLDW